MFSFRVIPEPLFDRAVSEVSDFLEILNGRDIFIIVKRNDGQKCFLFKLSAHHYFDRTIREFKIK